MMRLFHMLAICGLIASALYAYTIKYETIFHAEQAAKIKSQIKKEQGASAVLKAEWQFLNRPDRLQQAADRHLPDLQPMSVLQLARLSDIPVRAARGDEIGRKLEALGLLAPTATPKDARAVEARTPGR